MQSTVVKSGWGKWNHIVYSNKKRITIDYRPMVFYSDEMGRIILVR